MIGKIIYQLFTTDNTINDVLEGRVYPVTIPQGARAAESAVYQRKMSVTEKCDGGARIRTETATLWLMATEYATLQTLGERIEEIISPLQGTMQGVQVMSAEYLEDTDGFDEDLQLYFLEIGIEMTTIKN